MRYSFVLLAYNEAENIAGCIASIQALRQLGTSYEIVVVDDGSTDATADVVRGLAAEDDRVRLIGDGRNHGRGFARHRGVEAADGDYVAMIDSDILLGPDWLEICLAHLAAADVVGGIAVPDGDVAYLYRRFGLVPKTVTGSTTITGNNGLYARTVFEKLTFDPDLRDGEDVDFNHRSAALGLVSVCIPGLTVEHHENKSLRRSVAWLYQSGLGATRLLVAHQKVRQPDVAFAGTALLTVGAVVAAALGRPRWVALPIAATVGVASLHTSSKFELSLAHPLKAAGAVAVDSLFIACYYAGRTVATFRPSTYARAGRRESTPRRREMRS